MSGMEVLRIVLKWLLNVLVTSVVLALFEILLEKNRGWGSGLNPNGWGRKLFEGSVIARVAEKPYLTVYHLFLFLVIVPAGFSVEYLMWKSFGIGHTFYSGVLDGSGKSLNLQAGNLRLVLMLYFISIWLALIAVEDFLWFVMNWYYRNSLQKLLAGEIWWHRRWIRLGPVKLPRFYLSSLLAAGVFLYSFIHIIK
jgi:hypothetical protein